MTVMCKYSIIIPHFNDFERLKKLVSTIPIRSDIEIIIVDDNSDMLPNASTFPGREIQVILNFSGVQSAGACRNIGLKKARGKWLIFADADDFFTQDAFQVIDDNASEVYDIIYFSPTSIVCDTGLISVRHLVYKDLVNRFIVSGDAKINYWHHVPWSKLISRNFVNQYSIYFEETLAANDVMFSLKIGLKAKKINAIDEEIYCVTQSAGSLTSIKNIEVIRCRYEVIIRRNLLLFKSGLKFHQEPIYTVINAYRSVLTLKDIFYLFGLFFLGKLTLFPNSFKGYVTNPSLLFNRLLKSGEKK